MTRLPIDGQNDLNADPDGIEKLKQAKLGYYKGKGGKEYPATEEGLNRMRLDDEAYWESQNIVKDSIE